MGTDPMEAALQRPLSMTNCRSRAGSVFSAEFCHEAGAEPAVWHPASATAIEISKNVRFIKLFPPFRGAKPMVELAAMSNRFLESMGAFRFRKLMDHPSRPERRVGTAKPITAANQSASIDSHYSLDPNLNFQDKETL